MVSHLASGVFGLFAVTVPDSHFPALIFMPIFPSVFFISTTFLFGSPLPIVSYHCYCLDLYKLNSYKFLKSKYLHPYGNFHTKCPPNPPYLLKDVIPVWKVFMFFKCRKSTSEISQWVKALCTILMIWVQSQRPHLREGDN